MFDESLLCKFIENMKCGTDIFLKVKVVSVIFLKTFYDFPIIYSSNILRLVCACKHSCVGFEYNQNWLLETNRAFGYWHVGWLQEKHVLFESETLDSDRPNRLHRRDTPHHLKNKRINQALHMDKDKVASIIANVSITCLITDKYNFYYITWVYVINIKFKVFLALLTTFFWIVWKDLVRFFYSNSVIFYKISLFMLVVELHNLIA